ncbi:MAG: response regulator [bacterium]|nr:response regulator [Candidatus Wildermuthbacteria bacterium]MDP2664734.1 response regulator [bacterium]
MTILLIEDDPLLIDIYSTKLKESGFEVTVAEDGEKGLKSLEGAMPDLVLLDIVLPKQNGWEVLSKIRQNDRFKGLKVVLLSNLGQKEEIEKGLSLGADRYLIKAHFTPTQVVQEIQKLLTTNN